MAVRDLGYRPYEGTRLPASRNVWVLFRFGLRRAWASWLVKLATAFCWLPGAVAVGALGIRTVVLANAPDAAEAAKALPLEGSRLVVDTLGWVIWLVAGLVTLGAGAGAIALDLANRSLPFFFSKPVTPAQYLAGRAGAVSLWLFAALLVNAVLAVVGLVTFGDPALRLEMTGLVMPALLFSALAAAVLGGTSVGVSSLSPSRALTMSAWVLVFVAPTLVGSLVRNIADWPWLLLLSIPAMLAVVADALFKVEPEDAIRWWHAAPVLVALSGAALAWAHHRLRTAEVVA